MSESTDRLVSLDVDTPWGKPQMADAVAPGIVMYSTASHGGYRLSDERMAQLPQQLRGLNTYGKGHMSFTNPWFEEDCEAAIVAAAFPDCFPAGAEARAWEMIEAVYKVKRPCAHEWGQNGGRSYCLYCGVDGDA